MGGGEVASRNPAVGRVVWFFWLWRVCELCGEASGKCRQGLISLTCEWRSSVNQQVWWRREGVSSWNHCASQSILVFINRPPLNICNKLLAGFFYSDAFLLKMIFNVIHTLAAETDRKETCWCSLSSLEKVNNVISYRWRYGCNPGSFRNYATGQM